MLIYIVEDDTSIAKLLEYALKSRGYEVKCFENGTDFFKVLNKELPCLILLDIMLPDSDGLNILQRLRQNLATSGIWIFMVTAKTSEYDIIKGLDLGADDYIKKPFSVLELLARISAIERRMEENSTKTSILKFKDITLNNLKRSVTLKGEKIPFTYTEFEILKYLILNIDIVISRQQLLSKLWGGDYEGETRTIDMHIKHIRKKLERNKKHIKTIRGVGYMLSSKEE